MPAADDLSVWLRSAHGDAWQALGRLFEGRGGGVAARPGVRLMASGLAHPQWNNGDVSDPPAGARGGAGDDTDDVVAMARAFFATHGVPWGMRVPADMVWPHGRRLSRKRLMGLLTDEFLPAPVPDGVVLEAAAAEDLEAIVHVDSVAFAAPPDLQRPWLAALLQAPHEVVTVARARCDGHVVATGHAVAADGWAGPSVYIAGISVLPCARRRGLGSALCSWLVRRGFDAGARLAHLHPDDDRAAALYARLGFVEAGGLDVYVEL